MVETCCNSVHSYLPSHYWLAGVKWPTKPGAPMARRWRCQAFAYFGTEHSERGAWRTEPGTFKIRAASS